MGFRGGVDWPAEGILSARQAGGARFDIPFGRGLRLYCKRLISAELLASAGRRDSSWQGSRAAVWVSGRRATQGGGEQKAAAVQTLLILAERPRASASQRAQAPSETSSKRGRRPKLALGALSSSPDGASLSLIAARQPPACSSCSLVSRPDC